LAIVWVCGLGVDAYHSLGRGIEVPRFDCPACGLPMVFWGWYARYLRVESWCRQVSIRRQRCQACVISHAVLPSFVTYQRLDEVSVIGAGIEAMVAGAGSRGMAESLGLPHTTVRDWRRRFSRRAVLLAAGVAAVVVALTGSVDRLGADSEKAALSAMAAAWQSLASWGRVIGNAFVVANVICGSHLLSTNTDPPWALA